MLINNWRPITSLNLVYKILAKVLAIRIEKILPNIINSTRTGFVKGRYILENLITCWEAMNWAKASGQDCAMFLIDYEKAYDWIEWGFVMMMLEALGFSAHYCRNGLYFVVWGEGCSGD